MYILDKNNNNILTKGESIIYLISSITFICNIVNVYKLYYCV